MRALKSLIQRVSLKRLIRLIARLAATAAGVGIVASASTCSPRQAVLDEIRQIGTLKVATVNGPTTYLIGPGGEATGFEYDLVAGFAERLGVSLELITVATPPEAIDRTASREADMAAAGIGVNPARENEVWFGPPVHVVVPLLVYRSGKRKPESLSELDGRLAVVAGSAHAELLRQLQASDFPELSWEEIGDVESEDLLFRVADSELDYTVANSDLLAINQRYYPKLRVAFDLADTQALAWAFSNARDRSLIDAATAYLNSLADTELPRLQDRYFGHIDQVDSYGALTLANHVNSRLPKYRAAFEQASEDTGLDWRLIAAIGYQESHWDPSATSPTGVRGIMQLTNATAQRLKIADREDPFQSIEGGARYYRMMLDHLPPEIVEPDRTWLALAAYNIGYGHLLDARDLTEQSGGDPNRWLDIRERLPLLTQTKWHSKTKYGYARGHEAVTYVGNVRTYYDMLVWMTGVPAKEPEPPLEMPPAESPIPAPESKNPLDIDSPIL